MRNGKKEQKRSVRLLAIMTACVVAFSALTGCSQSSGKSPEESIVSVEQETQAGQEAQAEKEAQSGQKTSGERKCAEM